MGSADIGLIGLAVMGQNLVLNMDDHGFTVAVFNRTQATIDEFVGGSARGTKVIGTHSIEELVAALKRPRRVMLLVKAGRPVDDFIDQLLGRLEPGDIIIDGGNSNYRDTMRRTGLVESKGLLYIGTGVSGGEEGARHGPSIMPGGSPAAWPHVQPIFQAIAAKVEDGSPCCDWVGESGAGHFVKMVHNGIEYGDMQLICEAYALLQAAGLSTDEMADVFERWNEGELQSYLIQITAAALRQRDPESGRPVVDLILDKAGQKGTGQWTLINAAENAVVVSTINAAVEARVLSSMKAARVAASALLHGPAPALATADRAVLVARVHDALYASKVVSYAQGLDLMHTVSRKKDWGLDLAAIAGIWRGGCIIRARFLARISEAWRADPALANLMLAPFFTELLNRSQQAWRETVALAVRHGIAVPAMAASLAYYDSYRSARLPANLLQAQRDFFGAHTYERVDRPAGQWFHTAWPEVIE